MLVGLAVFLCALPNPYYYDDISLLRDNDWIRLAPAPGLWFKTFYFDSHRVLNGFRPILMLSYWMNSHVLGHRELSFRFVNILLHFLNSFLLVLFLKRLDKSPSRDFVAWGVGFLFLLHPTQTRSEEHTSEL